MNAWGDQHPVIVQARPAGVDDLLRIVELARQARAELSAERGGALWAVREARPEPLEESIGRTLAEPRALVLVGTYTGATVGYATVAEEDLPDGSTLALLSDVYVEPEARGVGVGEAMMDEILRWSSARGCRGIDALALPGLRETKNYFERFGLKARQLIVHRPLGQWADPAGAGEAEPAGRDPFEP